MHWLQLKNAKNEQGPEVHVPIDSNEGGGMLTFDKLYAFAVDLMGKEAAYKLTYIDADGDYVTLSSDADLKELEDYMTAEELKYMTVLVKPKKATNEEDNQEQFALMGEFTSALSKLAINARDTKEKKALTLVDAMELIVLAIDALEVVKDTAEWMIIKDDLEKALADDSFRAAVDDLSQSEEYKEVVDTILAAIYTQKEQHTESKMSGIEQIGDLLPLVHRICMECDMHASRHKGYHPIALRPWFLFRIGRVRCFYPYDHPFGHHCRGGRFHPHGHHHHHGPPHGCGRHGRGGRGRPPFQGSYDPDHPHLHGPPPHGGPFGPGHPYSRGPFPFGPDHLHPHGPPSFGGLFDPDHHHPSGPPPFAPPFDEEFFADSARGCRGGIRGRGSRGGRGGRRFGRGVCW